MIEIKRFDENFNLDTVTDEELLEGLKDGIVNSLRIYKGFENIDETNISLDNKTTFRTTHYGRDGNLYPNITLGAKAKISTEFFPASFQLLIMPFDIKMLITTPNLTTVKPVELLTAFNEFMLNKFPNSDYADKKQKYDEMAALRDRVYNRMVFGE